MVGFLLAASAGFWFSRESAFALGRKHPVSQVDAGARYRAFVIYITTSSNDLFHSAGNYPVMAAIRAQIFNHSKCARSPACRPCSAVAEAVSNPSPVLTNKGSTWYVSCPYIPLQIDAARLVPKL